MVAQKLIIWLHGVYFALLSYDNLGAVQRIGVEGRENNLFAWWARDGQRREEGRKRNFMTGSEINFTTRHTQTFNVLILGSTRFLVDGISPHRKTYFFDVYRQYF